MLSRKADDPPVVQVPSAAQDRPSWKTIGIIAAVGFVVGIAWPRLAGVRLGPSLPDASPAGSAPSSSSASSAPAPPAPPAPPLPVAVAPSVAAPPSAPVTPAANSPSTPPAATAPATTPPATTPPAGAPPAAPTTHVSDHIRSDAGSVAHASGNVSEGTAQIVWEVGLIRNAPKTGKILARVPRGTTIRVGPVKDEWYPVKPGDGFNGEGWIFRGAIGR